MCSTWLTVFVQFPALWTAFLRFLRKQNKLKCLAPLITILLISHKVGILYQQITTKLDWFLLLVYHKRFFFKYPIVKLWDSMSDCTSIKLIWCYIFLPRLQFIKAHVTLNATNSICQEQFYVLHSVFWKGLLLFQGFSLAHYRQNRPIMMFIPSGLNFNEKDTVSVSSRKCYRNQWVDLGAF